MAKSAPELAAELGLLVGAGGGDDDGSEGLADLNGPRAGATGAGVNEQRLPRLQSGPLVQGEPTEMEGVVQGGAIDAAHRVGDVERSSGVDDRVRRVPAMSHHRDPDDPAPDEVLGAWSRALDHADGLHAGHEGRIQGKGRCSARG